MSQIYVTIEQPSELLKDEPTFVRLRDDEGFVILLTIEAYNAFLNGGPGAIYALIGLLKENIEG